MSLLSPLNAHLQLQKVPRDAAPKGHRYMIALEELYPERKMA